MHNYKSNKTGSTIDQNSAEFEVPMSRRSFWNSVYVYKL